MLGFEESTHVPVLLADFKVVKCAIEIGPDGRKKEGVARDRSPMPKKRQESKKIVKMKDIIDKLGKVGSIKSNSKQKLLIRDERTTEESFQQGKFAIRPQSAGFTRHKSIEKMSQTKNFMISRKASVENITRGNSISKAQSFFTKTTETDSVIATENQINSMTEAWTFICSVISQIESHMNHQTWLKMFSRDIIVRIKQIVERKKDDLARQDMKKLEIKYGKKVAQLYDTAQRFMYLKEYEMCKAFHKILHKLLRKDYLNYEMTKFDRCFNYASELFGTNIEILRQNMAKMPRLAGRFKCLSFQEKSNLWPLRNLQTYKLYVYLTEDLTQRLITYVSLRSRQIAKQFRRLQQDKLEEHATKDGLFELVDLMNFRGSRFEAMVAEMDSPLSARILEIIKRQAVERIDWQLTNLYLGFCFFTYYKMKGNIEKGYVILSKAYDSNKEMVDLYLAMIVKYICTRDQLIYYLGEAERRQPERAVYPDISFSSYIARLQKLESRLPYVYDFLENTLKPCMKVEELQEIVRYAGKMALILNDNKRAVMYLENYLYMLDSVDRVNISRLLVHGKVKEDKVNELLLLNTKYMKYTNKLLKACYETKQFVKALTLITNLLFIFNNSLNLINYFDPHNHPTKKPNEVIIMDLKKFREISEMKKYYKGLLVVYTKEWKTAIDLHKKIWDMISQVQYKDMYKQVFFLSFREVIEYTESLKLFNLTNFVSFVSRYTNLPTVLQTAAAEEGQIDLESLTLQDYIVERQMDYYFPTYVGDLDKGFVEHKVLECITMNKQNNIKFKKTMFHAESLAAMKSVYRDTEAFRKKRVKKLHVWEVQTFFDASFDDPRFVNQLYRSIIAKYYEANNKKNDANFTSYLQTVLTDADPNSKNIIHSSISVLKSHYRKVLKDREDARIKTMTRAVLSHADRVVASQVHEEYQEKLNNIRSVEMRKFGDNPYKPSRFFKEIKLDYDILKLNHHINHYTSPTSKRQSGVPTQRRSKTPERAKQETFGGLFDLLNIEIFTAGFFEIFYKVLEFRTYRKRIKTRKKVLSALKNIKRFQKCGRLASILEKFSMMSQNNEAPKALKLDREKRKFAFVDYSLGEIQTRSYVLDVTDPLNRSCFFKPKLTFEGNAIVLEGNFKSQVSSKQITMSLMFPLSVDIMKEKERFFIRLGFGFQSFWPIIFEQFKTDYLDDLFKLSKEERLDLLKEQATQYKLFVQDIGLGFALKYTNYKEPLYRAKMTMNYYQKEDYHSLQLLMANLKILVKTVSFLMFRERLGFILKNEIRINALVDTLSRFKINIGVLYFNYLRVKYSVQDEYKNRLRFFIESSLSSPQKINLHMIMDLIDLFTYKCSLLMDQSAKEGHKAFFLSRSSVRFIQTTTLIYTVEIYAIIHLAEIERNAKFFKTMVSSYLDSVPDDRKEGFLLLLLLFFFEKSIEFDVRVDCFPCQKFQRYSNTMFEYDNMRKRKKFILKRYRFFKIEVDSQKMSFFQFLYLTNQSFGSTIQSSVWDFTRLVNRDQWLKELKLDFQVNYNLTEHIKYSSQSLMKLFVSILVDPFLNLHLKRRATSLVERNDSAFLYFLRDKYVYHVINFTREDTRMTLWDIPQFVFDYGKLRTIINPELKLLQNELMASIVHNSPYHDAEQMVYVKFLSLPVDLERFLRGEKGGQKRVPQDLQARIRLDQSMVKLNNRLQSIKNSIIGEQSESKSAISETLLQKKSKLPAKHQMFEKILAADFEAITRTGFKQLREREYLRDANQTLEIFDEKSSIVAKGTLVYAESQEPLVNIMKKYFLTRDKNLERLDAKGNEVNSFHNFVIDQQIRLFLEWNIDFNQYQRFPIKPILEAGFQGFNHHSLLFMFASWDHRHRDREFLFDMKLCIYFNNLPDRVLIDRLEVGLKYPMSQSQAFLTVLDPFDILHLLRLLKLRSRKQFYREIKYFLARLGHLMLPLALSNSVCKFYKNHVRPQNALQKVVLSKVGCSTRNSSPNDETSIAKVTETDRFSQSTLEVPSDKRLWEQEIKLFPRQIAETKSFNKLQTIGFVNYAVNLKIKSKEKISLYTFWDTSTLKYHLSKSDELVGRPLLDFWNSQSFLFSFLTKLKNQRSPVFVQSQTFLLLVNHLPTEDREAFKDCHTVKRHYLATFANRLKQVARLVFKNVEIHEDDVPYVKKRLIKKKMRNAAGLTDRSSIGGLDLWRQTIGGIGDTLQQYTKTKSRAMIEKADERLINIIGDLKTKKILDDKLVLDSEELIMCFEMNPSNSKNKIFKLILSWKDIKKFYINETFIRALFPNDNDYQKCVLYFASTNPNRVYIDLLRHILSYVEIKRQKLFSIPMVRLESVNNQKVYLRNKWSRFNSFRAQPHQIIAEECSNNISVVFHGIRRVASQYYIVTIYKNAYLKLFEVEFYCARYCRRYSTIFRSSTISKSQKAFMSQITHFLHTLDISKRFDDYNDFDATWCQVNNLKKRDVVNLISDISMYSSHEMNFANDTVFDIDNSAIDSYHTQHAGNNHDNLGLLNAKVTKRTSIFGTPNLSGFSSTAAYQSEKRALEDFVSLPDTPPDAVDFHSYWSQVSTQMKSTYLLREMKALELSVFGRSYLTSVRMKEGTASSELYLTHVAKFCSSFVKSLENIKAFVEIEVTINFTIVLGGSLQHLRAKVPQRGRIDQASPEGR